VAANERTRAELLAKLGGIRARAKNAAQRPSGQQRDRGIRQLEQSVQAAHIERLIREQIQDSVVICDLEGHILYVNDAVRRMLGIPTEELIGQHVTILGEDASTGPTQEEIVRKTLEDGLWRGEVINFTADGQAVILDCRTTLVRDDAGRPVALCGISTDVTERRQTEEALRRERDRAQSYLDIAEVILVALNADGRVDLINRKGCQLLGRTETEVLGQPWFDRFVPECDRERTKAIFARLMAGEPDAAERFENHVLAKDGQQWLIAWRNALLTDSDGRVIGTLSSGEDITDRKRQEAQRDARAQFRQALLDAIPIPVFYKDAEGRYLGCNRAFETFFSVRRDDLVGKTVYDIAPRQQADVYARADRELFDSPGTQVYEAQTTDARGRTLQVVFHKATFEDTEGKVAGLIGAVLDVTEQRRLRERSFHARKMQAMGRLAAGVAHDFRNQLMVVKWAAERLLRKYLVSDEGRQEVEEIIKAADISKILTDELLAFGRREMLHPEVVDLTALVEDLRSSLAAMLREDIRLSVVAGTRPCLARVDARQLRVAVMNLVANARDAMPTGGEIAITTGEARPQDEAAWAHGVPLGQYAVLSVRDTGVGMDDETKRHIFEPFHTTKNAGQGTGLGLAMVEGFVGQSGGFVEVDSEPGEGSTFRLHFPRAGQTRPAGARRGTARSTRGRH